MKPIKNKFKPILRATVLSLVTVTTVLLLNACAGTPKKEKLGLSINATTDVNPDMQGRPSPVILHIFELNSVEQFNGLDYVGLTQPSGAALGASLLAKKQEILQPGGSRELPLELDPQTTIIGLVAGYRDIDNATWRTSVPINQGKTKQLSITLNQQQIVTSISD